MVQMEMDFVIKEISEFAQGALIDRISKREFWVIQCAELGMQGRNDQQRSSRQKERGLKLEDDSRGDQAD